MAGDKKGKTGSVKGKPKAGAAKPAGSGSGGSNNAFYILIIVVLITVIVLLINRYADKGMFRFPSFSKEKNTGESENKSDNKQAKTAEDKEKKDTSADDKKNSDAEAPREKEVSIYFLKLDEKTEKIYLSQVKRKIQSDRPVENALQQLIKGPTADEEDKGFITAVPPTLRVRSVNIRGNTAEIDFSTAIEEGAAGDILIKRVQQIVYTATQFENIDSIVILINGKKRKTLGGDGLSIGGPLRR